MLVAQQGFDVYLVDVRGYGGSTRPPEMDQPPSENKPIVDTPTAVKDLGAAVDHILQKRGVAKIYLIGWSWGTAIAGMYTTTHNDKVNRLVLYAPAWIFTTRPAIGGGDAPLGAYRLVSRDSAKQRWLNGVPEDKKADLIPPGWFEQWADATWATDPAGAKQTPPVLRAPNGVLQDFRTYWIAGKPQYDPADIRVPTFLIHAEWDADLPSDQARGYFAKLTNAPYKRYVEIGEGSAESGPLPQYCRPGQARLIDLQDQPFEQHRLVAHGKAVFGVVVDTVHRMAGRKPAIRRAQVTARES